MENQDGKKKNIRRVLIIYTGGTIGMKKSPRGYIPATNFLRKLLKDSSLYFDKKFKNNTKLPFVTPLSEFKTRVAYDVLEYNPLLDSSNMQMEDWGRIAKNIKEHYDNFDAFIVLHGTDTMAFTASALSFMLENLAKTVIVTGSQIPLSKLRNDGNDNLLGALLIAGNYEIPEVCLYFNHKLLRGNRSVKFDASNLNAFHSGNFPPLVELGINIKVHWGLILSPPSSANFSIQEKMNPHVGALRLFPGITKKTLLNFASPPLKGLVLQTYGAGNAPDTNKDFLDALRTITKRGVVIVNCTQCFKGTVEGHYATGVALLEAGVIGGADMTVEAALTKLSYLFAKKYSPQEIKEKISQDLRGELTVTEKTKFSFHDKRFLKSVAFALKSDIGPVAEALNPVLLCSSASIGDLQHMKEMVENGIDVNIGDYDKRTALHLACAEGHMRIVEYLISQGANVNIEDRWGETPLNDAIRHQQDKVATLLKKNGAKLKVKYMATLMCDKARFGDKESIKRLIENGADINAADYDKRTALHLACAEGHYDLVKYLVSQKANVNAKDRWGATPLKDALKNNHKKIASLLKKTLKG